MSKYLEIVRQIVGDSEGSTPKASKTQTCEKSEISILSSLSSHPLEIANSPPAGANGEEHSAPKPRIEGRSKASLPHGREHWQGDALRRCRCGYRVHDAERIHCPSCGQELPQPAAAPEARTDRPVRAGQEEHPSALFGELLRDSCQIAGCPEHHRPAELPEGSRPLDRYPDRWRSPMPLRPCGALFCRACHVRGPSPHREGCAFPRLDPCGCLWFWLSSHGAIKCCACDPPTDLVLAEAWVLARETGDDWRIPGEILSLLHIRMPRQ